MTNQKPTKPKNVGGTSTNLLSADEEYERSIVFQQEIDCYIED